MLPKSTISYTITDEAPALATISFLPIISAFCKCADITVESKDISLAARILSQFPDSLTPNQQVPDDLALLGALAKKEEANIIKLPNISASLPQLKAAIAELQSQGYPIPNYPDNPISENEKQVRQKYDKIKGSAVNPVLREGNSDRRAPGAVKEYARKNPHSMGKWSKDSKSHVASMTEGDFYGSEKSLTVAENCNYKIEFIDCNGNTVVLKDFSPLKEGEIIDASFMSKKALSRFFKSEIEDAKLKSVLLSLHMKATMMKVSDPIIFGEMVSIYYEELLQKYAGVIEPLGFDPNNGIGDLYSKLDLLGDEKKNEIMTSFVTLYKNQPPLAMVDSDKGITNLHLPSDVIIDASMPAAIRNSGKMYGPDGKSYDTKFIIPDRAYAGVYAETIAYCKEHGAFSPVTMGSVSNVGLMAQKAEEYGSHDKTFEIKADGVVQVLSDNGTVLLEHRVENGDIWRMCQTKDAAIRDWVKLAVSRTRLTGDLAIFWLDKNRAHDRELIEKVNKYLPEHNLENLKIQILDPIRATRLSCERLTLGLNTISVTGNVLRDYLTDLFPILEVGTSAKMLSIVPLMDGGGLFETGAGGSAPKHVQQFLSEGHLRWDSLGEFLAIAASLEHLGIYSKNSKALVMAETLDRATSTLLSKDLSPGRDVFELDNRGSQFYLTLFWAQELASQTKEPELQKYFYNVSKQLKENEDKISLEFAKAQGRSESLGGYYHFNKELVRNAMRPSATFNEIIASI